jgi:hypothetical protein
LATLQDKITILEARNGLIQAQLNDAHTTLRRDNNAFRAEANTLERDNKTLQLDINALRRRARTL